MICRTVPATPPRTAATDRTPTRAAAWPERRSLPELAGGRTSELTVRTMPEEPQLTIPGQLVAAVEEDRDAGVEAACEHILAIRDSGAFDGVHLIPVSRYRQVAARLEADL